jgi:hypothetical protein
MNRKLVFVHGRSQQGKDSIALKAEWVHSWADGLEKSRLPMPIAETDIRFPYYGDTLEGLIEGKPNDQVAEVIVRGTVDKAPERAFMSAVLEEVRKKAGISEAQLAALSTAEVVQRGPLNWEWLQTILKAIDRNVPFGSGASIAVATYDVFQYLNNKVVAKKIDDGVIKAFEPGVETVVVSHSLGTVVAYNLLSREGKARGWKVPLFVTVGSPLAVTAIRASLPRREVPSCVGKWFNAMDERDVVALYPLDQANFDVSPGVIENKTDVKNPTENRHGISGYLGDEGVARRICEALNG